MPRLKKPSNAEFLARQKEIDDRVRAGGISLSDGLRELRKVYGMTQTQLSRLTKVPRYQVSDIESGKANPTRDTLNRLLKPFGYVVGIVSPDRERG